jgi:hypothetical protein
MSIVKKSLGTQTGIYLELANFVLVVSPVPGLGF